MKFLQSLRKDFDSIVKENTLKKSIIESGGRVILAEMVINTPNIYGAIENTSLLNGFGADMITLKKFDYQNDYLKTYISYKNLTNGLIGLNFELKAEGVDIDTGTEERFKELNNTVDYVIFTMYPNSGISLQLLTDKITQIRKYYAGLLLINRYIETPFENPMDRVNEIQSLSQLPIDGYTIPIPGTVPGITVEIATKLINELHKYKFLSVGSMCTSQESSDVTTVKHLAINAKICGYDIHLIGDAGANMMPEPENIKEYSITIRGKRHTYFRTINK